MLKLDRNSVSNWLASEEDFAYVFMHYSFSWHQAAGLHIEINDKLVKEAHQEWVKICSDWKKNKFEQGTANLSYTKTFAILLYALSRKGYCGAMKDFVSKKSGSPKFNGSEEFRQEIRSDVLGAPEIVTALEFCLSVLNFYEANRLDRETDFVFRMTESGRHDLIAALHSKEMSAEALFIALENLYSRH